ncbi:MAG: hypothetical protein ACTHJ4_06195, partial [Candidatus Nucleicultricaceae bacterium]
MLNGPFLKKFFFLLLQVMNVETLFATETLIEFDVKSFWSNAHVQVLSFADYTLLRGRPLAIVSVSHEEDVYIKAFYRSSGMNSGSKNTWLPFNNISGRFLESKFIQTYVEKVADSSHDISDIRALLPQSAKELACRIGNWVNLGLSASLGGGFWDSDEGEALKDRLGMKQVVHIASAEQIELENAATVKEWMKAHGCKVIPAYLQANQIKYAQFSYETMHTLVHVIKGTRHKDTEVGFRDLCMKLHPVVKPEAMQVLAPGFSVEESVNDFSQYVAQNFSIDQYRIKSKSFLPISIGFYVQSLPKFNVDFSLRLALDMNIITYLSEVKKYDPIGV